METQQTIQQIEKYLSDYFQRGASMSINELLDIQDKVAIHSYRLAERAAEAKSEYNGCYFIRKVSINRQMQGLINSKISKAAAQIQAESSEDGEAKMKAELEAEAEAYKLDLLLGQVNKVLSAIQQRVSYLKKEKSDSNA